MLSSKSVRQTYLDFFAKRGHEVVRSYPLVPANDPTLLFTNAGMVQFKDVFTGRESRPYKRAASSQKCVRAGGKHNDLENVGFTARHHTFFEMLGNFSFGDYFKTDAIEWAYTLLVKELGLDPKRMMYTVYDGSGAKLPGVPADDEARSLWKKVAGVGDDRVLGLGEKDNFWQMGDVGPMGPCTEIHFHQGDDLPCPEPVCKGPACDCDRWLEIWNLVFMQYERREKDGQLFTLPAPSVDTGAGLERVTAVIQGKRTNYDTDLFVPLLELVREISGRTDPPESLRVIADHARASAFLIADGVFPDKTGREYVLRRIFRRAVRHGFQRLGIERPFMHEVCAKVVAMMGDVYPELVERRQLIEKICLEEETRFRRTLERGLGLLDEEFARLDAVGQKVVDGSTVFQLYDTFGFPDDMTALVAAERGFSVDLEEFKRIMARPRGPEFKGAGEAVDDAYKKLAQELPATEFLGYETTTARGKVLAVTAGAKPDERRVVVDRTPFYASSGGQIGDTGTLGPWQVVDTTRPAGDLVVHHVLATGGDVKLGDEVELVVDAERRDAIRANHSATHLLHLALKRVLGEHAAQKGSLVAPDRLRFDYSHFSPLTDDEKHRIEDLVNAEVRANRDSSTEVLPIEQAKKAGAVHMFGEKYGDKVRVVRIGRESLEFCGGTHVRRAGDIGLFKIVGESGIAQGVRRIEAVTGAGALAWVRALEDTATRAAEKLKRAPGDLVPAVEKVLGDLKARDKEIAELKRKLASGGTRDLLADVRDVGGVKVLVTKTDVADPAALGEVGDALRDKLGSGVIVLFGVGAERVSVLGVVTKDLVAKYHAGKIVAEVSGTLGGKGGGRPDRAQGGGPATANVDDAVARVFEIVR